MKVWPNEIPSLLAKSGLPVVTCLYGEDPFRSIEAADALLAYAREHDHEIKRIHLDKQTNWDALATELGAISLFESNKLVFLQLPFESKLPDKFAQNLLKIIPLCTQGSHLLVQIGALNKNQTKAKWFTTLSSTPTHLISQCNTPSGKQLLGWIREQLERAKLKFDYEVIDYLAYRCNGNLLAAKQEIDLLKLAASHAGDSDKSKGKKPRFLTIALTKQICSDHARFTFYDLKDACLRGQYHQVMHIIDHLEAQTKKSELYGLVAIIQYEVSRLLRIQQQLDSHQTLSMALKNEHIPGFLDTLYRDAFVHLSQQKLRYLVELIDAAERAVKGDHLHSPWMQIRLLCGVFSSQHEASRLMAFARTESPEQLYHAI